MEMTPSPAARTVTPGRRATELFNLAIRIALVFGIVFFGNLFLRDRFVRADLTQEKIYTISDATKKILSELTDRVTIKAYVSEELPKSVAHIPARLRDFLAEYETYGRGLVKVTFIDPKTDAGEAEIARQIGINPYPLEEIQADQVKVVNCYLSLAIFFGAQQEHLNLPETGINEYDITRAIRKVSKGELPKIGVIAPDPPPRNPSPDASPPVTFQRFQTELETQYRVQRVYTKTGNPVPEDIGTLLVIRPNGLSPRDAFEIDQFVMRGGKAIFCLDGNEYQPTGGGIKRTAITSGLDEMLDAYGVKLRPELVLDKRHNAVNVAQQQGPIRVVQQIPYPFWLRVQRDTMSPDSPIVKNLDLVQLFWAQPLEIQKEKLGNVAVTDLLKSSPDSWLRSDTANVNVDPVGAAYLPPADKDRKSEVLAALLVGKFRSSFAGKEVPPVPPPADAPEGGAPPGPGAGAGADGFPPNLPPEIREQLQKRGLSTTPEKAPAPGAPKETPPAPPKKELPPPAPPQGEGGTPAPAQPAPAAQDKSPAPAPNAAAPPAPAATDPQEDEFDESAEPAEPPREVIAESPETRVLVIGDSDFLADNFLESNWAFFLNTIDWFAQDEDMISIRSRGAADRTIEKTEEGERKILKLTGTLALPLFVAIFGSVYLTLRKRGRRTAAAS